MNGAEDIEFNELVGCGWKLQSSQRHVSYLPAAAVPSGGRTGWRQQPCIGGRDIIWVIFASAYAVPE